MSQSIVISEDNSLQRCVNVRNNVSVYVLKTWSCEFAIWETLRDTGTQQPLYIVILCWYR